jgi:hypothetical protein
VYGGLGSLALTNYEQLSRHCDKIELGSLQCIKCGLAEASMSFCSKKIPTTALKISRIR